MVQPVFFDLIGKSPFDSLRHHMKLACRCAHLLTPLVDAVIQEDWAAAERTSADIHALESEADDFKRHIRLSLHKGLFLPVPRVEILELIKVQDRIPNILQDVAVLMIERNMSLPPDIHAPFRDLVSQALQTCEYAQDAIEELSVFFASGFSGNISDLLEKMLSKVAKMEHIADTCAVDVRGALFRLESTLPPVDVMFLYEAVTLVSRLADAAESISDRLLLMLAHE